MRNFARLTTLLASATLTAGCSTVRSAEIGPPPTDTKAPVDGSGIAYFLPRQLATVTVKRSELSLDKAIKTLGEAELALAAAKAQVAAAKAAIKETENAIVSRGDIPAVRDLLIARLADEKKALTAAEGALTKKAADHKKAAETLAATASQPTRNADKKHNVTVGISLLPPSPDPNHGYRLNPRHSAFRDDEHKLAISPSGLLTSLDVVATDRSADALIELAAFAGAITAPVPRLRGEEQPKCPAALPEEVTLIVDFNNTAEVYNLNSKMGCMGARIRVIDDAPAFGKPTGSNGQYEGLVYRTPVEILVEVQKCQAKEGKCKGDADWFPTAVLALSLPQAGPISHIPQNAGFFTKTTYGTAFKDGILVSYSSNRPSEVLHVAAAPMRVVQGFFDGASKIISLRTGQANSQVEAFNAQRKLSEADVAAMQAQAKRDQLYRCINDRILKGEPTDPCYATP